jgi:hypothetical protein
MNNSSDGETKSLSDEAQSSYMEEETMEEETEVFLKPNMTDEDKRVLEKLRKFRDSHNQVPEEERIPISHPDKYSVDD